ncbi:hypothetical protein CEXT_615791 [Caerostris extrusa]|uniref:Uncharacterized protein n=1 Tax=Caerostris extrusa TaxID=172846 RepID=A0AAV4SKC9_CAEEX|nr:hypothetical protein CEXT_615791 [Caerostris extrusa]
MDTVDAPTATEFAMSTGLYLEGWRGCVGVAEPNMKFYLGEWTWSWIKISAKGPIILLCFQQPLFSVSEIFRWFGWCRKIGFRHFGANATLFAFSGFFGGWLVSQDRFPPLRRELEWWKQMRERETSKCSGSLTQLKRIPGLPDRLFNCRRQRLKGSSRKIFIANKKQSEPTAVPSKTHSLGDKE